MEIAIEQIGVLPWRLDEEKDKGIAGIAEIDRDANILPGTDRTSAMVDDLGIAGNIPRDAVMLRLYDWNLFARYLVCRRSADWLGKACSACLAEIRGPAMRIAR